MTDQNQNPNPNTINPNMDEQNVDIFGGSDDIFENSDILEPIKETFEAKPELEEDNDVSYVPKNNAEYNSFETAETTPVENVDMFENTIEEQKEYEPMTNDYVVPEVNMEINEEKNVEENSDFLESDTILGFENQEQVEEPKMDVFEDIQWIEPIEHIDNTLENLSKEEQNNSDILDNDEPDFENSPEIDALDHLDEIDVDNLEDMEPEPELESVVETPDVLETIPEIEPIQEDEKIDEIVEPIQEIQEIKQEEDIINEEPLEQLRPIEEIKENIKEDEIETEEQKEEQDEIEKEKEAWTQREISVEVDEDKSDLQKKFYEIIRETKNVHELVKKDLSEGFDLLGGNDDRQKTTYKIFVWDEFVNIEKTEFNKSDESEEIHSLNFELENNSLKINIDDETLYDELEDLLDNPSKKMQVSEKLNKFIFLVNEEYKKIEKDKKQKEKRNIIKWIFRNFVF